MSESEVGPAISSSDIEGVRATVRECFADLLGCTADEIGSNDTFIEMGADSLLLLQATEAIRKSFGVSVPFRSLIESLPTVAALTDYLVLQGCVGKSPSGEETGAIVPVLSENPNPTGPTANKALPSVDESQYQAKNGSGGHALETVILQQLGIMKRQFDVMSRQLGILRGTNGGLEAEPSDHTRRPDSVAEYPSLPEDSSSEVESDRGVPSEKGTSSVESSVARQRVSRGVRPKAFVAFQPIEIESASSLTARQRRHVDDLIARVCSRTRQSKRFAQDFRPVLADSRLTANYRHLWKDMVYQIIPETASGARVWDVDGNEYVDLAMGFGSLLFGHSPQFLIQELQDQIGRGIQIGLESRRAGQVAEIICELTGMERVAFCNSGTEAVMTALRLARAATGHSKVAMFTGSYHGTYDGVLVGTSRGPKGELRGVPLAPGVPEQLMKDVLLIEYCDPMAVSVLKAQSTDLAAVLVEPKQSRRPDMQAEEFLRDLRSFTEEAGIPLIFDEVVTGFRMHPGGIQGLTGIRADITTYGKSLGGGLPIGVIAGKSAYLDAIDGGMWSYGDETYPQSKQTFFAGTFFQHPLVMTAAWQVLKHIRQNGASLYQQLEERTSRLVDTLNTEMQQLGTPVKVAHFKSLFDFLFPQQQRYGDLLFYHLLEKGVFTAETRVCFLSTAHTDKDIDYVVRATRESVEELQQGGFLLEATFDNPGMRLKPMSRDRVSNPGANTVLPDPTPRDKTREHEVSYTAPLTEGQKGLWILTRMGGEAAFAFNESIALRLIGRFRVEAMRQAFQTVIGRHDSLRTSFSGDGDQLSVFSSVSLPIPVVALSRVFEGELETQLDAALAMEAKSPFDLADGPALRVRIIKLGGDEHVLIFTAHHIVVDGVSFDVIQRELSAAYSAECYGVPCSLEPPMQFREYEELLSLSRQKPDYQVAKSYWLTQFAGTLPVLDLPGTRSRPPLQTYVGSRQTVEIPRSLEKGLKAFGSREGCTLFMILLAGFKLLLHHLSDQDDVVVGVHSAGQLLAGNKDLVGFCINMLPLRTKIQDDIAVSKFVKLVKRTLLDAYSHQSYSFPTLIKDLSSKREPSRPPLVSAVFNIDRVGSEPEFFNLRVETIPNPVTFARFDLLWNLTHIGDSIILNCTYNADLFEPRTIKEWVELYIALLDNLVAQPTSTIGQLRQGLKECNMRLLLEREQELHKGKLRSLDRIERKAITLSN
jgi:glutamate-1-semialdehyde aminotransferase/acyl carrier protein